MSLNRVDTWMVEIVLDEKRTRLARAAALTQAFIWFDHPRGHEFWLAEERRLLDWGRLSPEAERELRLLLVVEGKGAKE